MRAGRGATCAEHTVPADKPSSTFCRIANKRRLSSDTTRVSAELTCVLFGQFGDVFLVENVLLGGHPVSQQQDEQDGDRGEHQQLHAGPERRHDRRKATRTEKRVAEGDTRGGELGQTDSSQHAIG